jgi:hypothetical protein
MHTTSPARVTTTVTFRILPDEDPDIGYLEQPGFENRAAEYDRGDFGFVGLRAEVTIHDPRSGVLTTVSSAGLWGIESDSGEEYFRQVGAEELDTLRDELVARNITITDSAPVVVYA